MWPTPTSREGTGPGHPDSKKGSPNLRTVAQMWPTPCAQDGKNSTLPPSQQERDTIPGALMRQMWPTPVGPNGGRAPKGGMSRTGMTPDGKKRQVDLQHAVRMSQPGQEATGNSPTPSASGTRQPGQKLSVEFVTWLMGFPIRWTELQ